MKVVDFKFVKCKAVSLIVVFCNITSWDTLRKRQTDERTSHHTPPHHLKKKKKDYVFIISNGKCKKCNHFWCTQFTP